MNEAKQVVTQIFQQHNISVPANRRALFDKFLQDEQNRKAVGQIIQNQQQLMTRWKLEERLAAIAQQPMRVLNATVGKPYETLFDLDKMGLTDITDFQFEGLHELGLAYDQKSKQITGVPTHSGDYKINFLFHLQGEDITSEFHEKVIPFIINPDPKSLWKNLESDRTDPYWKEDNITVFVPFLDRHLLASSRRGRSHANIGAFREDDFAFKDLENKWGIAVVADGAGSAKFSRQGSTIACNGIIDYFSQTDITANLATFDQLFENFLNDSNDKSKKAVHRFVYNNLGKAALEVHKKLAAFAQEKGITLKDLSTTLVFSLIKKYEAGYVLLSFGVGDCPMAIVNPDLTEVHLMNWIDVGEFSGGTRFITMPEIFQNEKFATRFGFKLVKDFSYLVLMSDGIYDPKFSVESNLANVKKWKTFFNDLAGQNDEKVKVDLSIDNDNIEDQFSQWMDFWSPGNHDDRTLLIVF